MHNLPHYRVTATKNPEKQHHATVTIHTQGTNKVSDEIKTAAERLVAGQYYGDGGNLIEAIQARKADGMLVANAYPADLAAR